MSKQAQNERLIQKLRKRIARLEQENRQCQIVQQEMCEEQKRVQKLAKAAQERAAEMTKANDALRRSVNVLATESNLNQFIGHVLRVTAEQFDAPLAEYWQVTNPNIGQVVGWWGHNQIHGFGEEHNHPAKAPGVRFPPHMLENGQLSTRRTHFVSPFDHSVEPIQGEFPCDPQAWYRAYDAYWQLNLPLVIGEICFGVIIFWLPSARSFTKQQVELGYALAQQITLAIRLCQLADEAKQEAEQAAILQERNRIAREIHDTLAQCLTGIIIQLQAATDSHTANPLNHIAIATEMAKSGLTEARRSVRALRPQVLEAASLDAALVQLVSQIQSDRLHSNCRILGTPYTLPVEVESNLLRIAQEALTNCIRHAKATQVKLDLVYQPEQVTLCIKDNGCGFSPSLTTQGYGLVGMWERARAITANLTITSQPNEGTDVVVILSISQVDT